jgi:tRNA dimethylallyltransferase
MSLLENKLPLVVIVGPTAVGKTETALKIIQKFDGEIVSADSRLFYRGMDIGTAKPSRTEQNIVPHHLIDVVDPDVTWSLGIFQQEAEKIIHGIHEKGKIPFLVGGTGQFIRAVTEGWNIPRQEPDHRMRAVLLNWSEEIGSDGLYQKLKILDPIAAENIDARNVRRVIRAIEVCLLTGSRFSSQRSKLISPYDLLILGLRRDRTELFSRIDARIESMFQSGFIDEVKSLLDRGYSPDLPSFSAIGYREISAYLDGKTTLEEAKLLIKRGTHQYVRRQANWFKESDPYIHWFPVDDLGIQQMIELIKNHLPSKGTKHD